MIDRLVRVSLRIVTMPIQSQGIITRDNVSVYISAVAYFRVIDPVKSVIAIENVDSAINQIAQTTLRKVVGQHTLDEALSETDVINANIQKILDVATLEWGVAVNLVELKDIQLPDSMKRAMARQAEAEREKRAKIIAAEGESMAAAALGEASDNCGTCKRWPSSGWREEHHRGVPGADDERDRRNQQLPHPGNRRRARDHTPASHSQTTGTGTIGGRRGNHQRGARQRCGSRIGAHGRLTAQSGAQSSGATLRLSVSVGVGGHGPATPFAARFAAPSAGHPIGWLTQRQYRTSVPKQFPARRRTWPPEIRWEAPICGWFAASKDTGAQANRWCKADRTCHIVREPAR